MDPAPIAWEIHDRLLASGHRMPFLVTLNLDPIARMWYAQDVNRDIGTEAARLVRDAEIAAARTAMPVPGVREALHACHASGRGIAVVGDTSSHAMETYLDLHGLRQFVGAVVGRESLFPLPAGDRTGETLLKKAAHALDAKPADCALVTLSPESTLVARLAGIRSLGVVNKRGPRKHLAAPPDAVAVSSMADLADGFATVPALST
ncbi:HAD family hydrolase [Nonomuraea rhodomycinica]|uniref:HAD family phosphatase n=1 Tax=Nonomuraea rhodomycinica TaxID=1712872 RepID=A0A7Y6MDD1_9ACTN|nr:HAD family phosphatase [Nonomuraea rhodomycinica]NUW44343.1 HAD family phosphatase [Nonomuraea rhodomycinica]